jgi:CDP-4-dehydro-6-deoxyglucose reductase/ferredoxin-NAD(P)+ reductase (naphthalene dioxygenase ferredoxin-specific)
MIHPVRRLACRVDAKDALTHDIWLLRLLVRDGPPLAFSAGQFASVGAAGHAPRDYSMANRPDEPLMEFHIRNSGRGLSAHIAERVAPGDPVDVAGPFGVSHLRPRHRGPILAIAGGSGLAPVRSIVETALSRGHPAPIHLYVGGRDERDLYLVEHFAALARLHPRLAFVPVLSEPSRPTRRRTGLVGEVAAGDITSLAGFKAYLAGPPEMVEAARRLLLARGLAGRDIHADPFVAAAEAPRR